MVVDPGLVPGRDAILRPLAEMEIAPEQITDVVLSHHHPDHTLNAALFPNARVHDHWAWYRDDLWVDRPAEGFELSSSIRLIETPGIPRRTSRRWWTPTKGWSCSRTCGGPRRSRWRTRSRPSPSGAPRNRARVLALPGLRTIVPGHGAPFEPGPDTPR